uniref:Uncharacterized protein n=1 Tax=viral metagenome TaxID=1070528 RepID=A0A6C0LY52_9ZZZZ
MANDSYMIVLVGTCMTDRNKHMKYLRHKFEIAPKDPEDNVLQFTTNGVDVTIWNGTTVAWYDLVLCDDERWAQTDGAIIICADRKEQVVLKQELRRYCPSIPVISIYTMSCGRSAPMVPSVGSLDSIIEHMKTAKAAKDVVA